tara:strand:- start:52 stop:348 length:297 start_codon:yes stop_codon:yes gene_type:complete
MSHEYQLFPTEEEEFPLIQLEPVRPETTSYGFFLIPDEPSYLRQEFDGLMFEGVQYTWDEFDFRLGVEYKGTVPEPSCTSLLMAVVIGIMVVRKLINK